MVELIISSKDNRNVKLVRSLADKKGRRASGLFLTEGVANIREALASDLQAEMLLYADGCQSRPAWPKLRKARGCCWFCASQPVRQRLLRLRLLGVRWPFWTACRTPVMLALFYVLLGLLVWAVCCLLMNVRIFSAPRWLGPLWALCIICRRWPCRTTRPGRCCNS